MNIKNRFFLIYKKIANILSGLGIGNFYLVKLSHDFVISILKPNFIKVNGNTMFLDKNDCSRLSVKGIYEPFETDIVNKEIREGDVVLDIGANIGYYTLIFAKLVGKSGCVFSFEPDAENFSILKKNVEANGYKNIILEQKAVSNIIGKTDFYMASDVKFHAMYKTDESIGSVKIDSTSLDGYFKDYNKQINFIKMDIEGAELSALRGASLFFKNNNSLKLITEFNPVLIKKFGGDPQEYLNLLLENGFKLYDINEKDRKIELTSKADLIEKYPVKDGIYTNLLCIKK